jgi:hypothetical protein
MLARLRVWAAAVRDRRGWHADNPAEASALASSLCALLDVREHLQAGNSREIADRNVALLVGMIVLTGALWLAA